MLKAASFAVLEKIFSRCLNGEKLLNEWKKAVISSILKKKIAERNYRRVCIIATVAQLYGKILEYRIKTQIMESEEQNGFREERSYIDGSFTLKHLFEESVE